MAPNPLAWGTVHAVIAADALPVLGAILSGIAALIGGIAGLLAWNSKRRTDASTVQLDGVRVSLTSLQAALTQSDKINAQLRLDLLSEEDVSTNLQQQVDELRAEMQSMRSKYERQLLILRREVARLGGNPDQLEGT